MARKFFRKFMPSREKVHSERALRWLKPIMNRPYLWHLNRNGVASSVGWGMFWALIPIPGQSIPAVLCTIWSRGNVPLALAATWISNPLTLIPHWWSAYVIGKFILRSDGVEDIEWTTAYWEVKTQSLSSFWAFISTNFWNFYLPLMIGSIVEGLIVGGLGYLLVMSLWRRHSANRWTASRHKAGTLPTPIPPPTEGSPP